MVSRAGMEFELEVFEAVRTILDNREMGFDPKWSQVFHHRGYFSPVRDKEIIFDVSVELTLPGASVPSIIWVWECKDYRSLVPVDDVEEFHAKLDQIGADRTKGTVITRSGFQASAFNFARSKGIGLARKMPQQQVDWILYRLKPAELLALSADHADIKRALTESEFISKNQEFFGLTGRFRTMRALTLEKYLRLQLEEWGFPATL